MAPKPRVRKESIATKEVSSVPKTEQDASKAMPPPPDPLVPRAILEPELNGLAACLKNAAVKTGQLYSFYADTRRLGIERHAPNPPRSLTASLGREVEKYDQLCDSIESHLLRAITVLQRDLRREERRLEDAEKASVASRTRSKSTSVSPASARVSLPPASDIALASNASKSTPSLPPSGPTNSPPAAGSSVGLGRRPSAISISSLHRPAFPLKLDLSSTALRITAEEASMFSSGLASPITLAPKSARAAGPNEFPPELMAALASSTANTINGPVDIDLTVSDADQSVNEGVKPPNTNAGNTADKPIELDIEAMDIDMAMTDLFGDPADANSTDTGTAADGLFSPVGGENDIVASASDSAAKPDKPDSNFLGALSESNSGDDIFASLAAERDPNEPQQSKVDSSPSQFVPSPRALLASFSSPSHLQPADPLSSNNVKFQGGEVPFDLNSLDLSQLSPGFFANASESDMNFSMDIEDFLDLERVGQTKEDVEPKPELT